MHLCHLLQYLACSTSQNILLSEKIGLPYKEETITDINLLTIKSLYPFLAIEQFAKREEAINGADWALIVKENEIHITFRVQAKRISSSNKPIFSKLHSYQARSQPKSQIKTLIDRAHHDRAIPIYVFYTHLNCNKGCLYGYAEIIDKTKKDDLASLEPHLKPWHKLICNCDYDFNKNLINNIINDYNLTLKHNEINFSINIEDCNKIYKAEFINSILNNKQISSNNIEQAIELGYKGYIYINLDKD